jgi:hypothetical protein
VSNYCYWSKAYLIPSQLLHDSNASCVSAIVISGEAGLDEGLVVGGRLLSIPDVFTDLSTLLLLIPNFGKTSLQLCHQRTVRSSGRGL